MWALLVKGMLFFKTCHWSRGISIKSDKQNPSPTSLLYRFDQPVPGIMTMFGDSDACFAGWLHYCVSWRFVQLEVVNHRRTNNNNNNSNSNNNNNNTMERPFQRFLISNQYNWMYQGVGFSNAYPPEN